MTKEERRAYQKEWRAKNRDKVNAYMREYGVKYREKNREKMREKHRRWAEKNRARASKLQMDYYYRNREKCLAKDREYRAANKDRVRRRQKKYKLSKTYGVSEAETAALIEVQGGICPGCLGPLGEGACVDHSHATGDIRGLLCRLCNWAVGHAKDHPDTLRRLAAYLERSAN